MSDNVFEFPRPLSPVGTLREVAEQFADCVLGIAAERAMRGEVSDQDTDPEVFLRKHAEEILQETRVIVAGRSFKEAAG